MNPGYLVPFDFGCPQVYIDDKQAVNVILNSQSLICWNKFVWVETCCVCVCVFGTFARANI